MALASAAGRSDRVWAGWIVAAILLIVLIGFGRSFFLAPLFARPPRWAAPEPLFYVHGFVFSAWFGLLGAQAWLIRAGSVALHRRLGYAGLSIATAIVALGTYSALAAANRPGGFIETPMPPEQFLIVPLRDMATFAVFFGLGVARRNRAASHKRWMLLASITLLGAPLARLAFMLEWPAPVIDIGSDVLFVGALAAWDLDTRRKISAETLWGGGAIIVSKLVAAPFAATPAWTGAALWMMSFAGPP